MLQALLYKEWIKLRWLLAGGLAVGLVTLGYVWSELAFVVRNNGAVTVWDAVLRQGFIFYGTFRFFPIALGLVLGLFQMVPEVQSKRIKLSMHLPLPYVRILMGHSLIGSGFYLLITLFSSLVLVGLASVYFPLEIVASTALTIVPWVLAGGTAYLATCLAVLEPNWPRRVAYAVLGSASVYISYRFPSAEAYAQVLPFLMGIALAYVPSLAWSGSRFKKGVRS